MACFSFLLIVLVIILQKCDNAPANSSVFYIASRTLFHFFLIPLHISKKDDYEET